MNAHKALNIQKTRRAARTRAKILGTAVRPRLSVFRSNKFIDAQVIDDKSGATLMAITGKSVFKKGQTKTAQAVLVGESLAKLAKEKGVSQVIFDRRNYRYHGRVKALAEAVRASGVSF